jgi:predicted TPR repeat methyltransferase
MSKIYDLVIYHYDNLVAKLLWIKYRKRPYIEFYRAVMRHTSKTNLKGSTGGGDWDKHAKKQLDRLKRYGMKQHHTLFDLGCGQLRGGRYAVAYLDKGNYYGNDISPEILKEASEVLRMEGLADKDAHLFLTDNLEFNEVKGKTFDFIHAQSVLSHMPPEDIESLFKNIKKIMHKDTQFLASFFISKNATIYPFHNMKNFAFPFEWLRKTGKENGLLVELVETDLKQKLIRVTLAD